MKLTSLFENLEYKENKPAIYVLFETTFTKEIRIAMKKGQVMKEHQTPFPIVVEIVKGNIEFGVEGGILKLKKGYLVALDGGVPHDLTAKEDSIIRLTLTKSDNTSRVKKIVND